MSQPTAIVFGVGTTRGVGGAVCKRFAQEGYHVIVTGRTLEKIEEVVADIRRSGIGSAEALQTDVTVEGQVIAAFDLAMSPGAGRAPADVVVFNAGNNALIDFTQLTASQFEDFWRVGCYAGFLVGREAARRLVPLGRGTVIFTGASGSLRGKPGFAHFAAAKAGLRMISQSMAREYGPKGIHVAHVVIDGGILGDRLRNAAPARVESIGEEGLLGYEAIAENYWTLHCQPRSAWTQELDLRPFKESW
ncbi:MULTISPECIES: SDR family NAD(P)-dependent oxidoreductase [unclassified Pseudomonas]|uniref:SDR family NAD(P)-dependent oxidoreductase n=1 Tax=unclassified Pseudomonas TaxID=196821 RepID=UPI0004847F84|nr:MULTISPECIES: SDR family NAD(P)-dependent oxidoreductase [unclassified Pseudomonas]RAS21455.1 NADP-dependent 3-hydroxy acid dehydrogenase YdfG [Pseudomonas sp. URMO17WK12:I7]SMF68961.1 NADP-dependent 3-hydroxy acid dehydrogenase YdfG [Pseudomonas sp. URMO17WK12:I5]